jgi:SAM-dependent methyltransferase
MSHLKYYEYQAIARGVRGREDVARIARQNAYIYERLLPPWLGGNLGARMVDLACGHGSFLFWLKERGYTHASGVDSSPQQIALAREAGLAAEEFDVMLWLRKQPSGSQEILFALDFIEHISKDDLMVFLGESARVLRPGGRLILRYPNGDSPLVGLNLFNDITHVWTYTTNCLNSLARMHGFQSTAFADEGYAVARDQRWWKVPLGRLSACILKRLLQTVSREGVNFWSSSIWACLQK